MHRLALDDVDAYPADNDELQACSTLTINVARVPIGVNAPRTKPAPSTPSRQPFSLASVTGRVGRVSPCAPSSRWGECSGEPTRPRSRNREIADRQSASVPCALPSWWGEFPDKPSRCRNGNPNQRPKGQARRLPVLGGITNPEHPYNVLIHSRECYPVF